jgi:hypothetical protein
LVPGNPDFFWALRNSIKPSGKCQSGPKENQDFQCLNPSHLPK